MNHLVLTDRNSSSVKVLVSLPNRKLECLDNGVSASLVSSLSSNESIEQIIEINPHQLNKSASPLVTIPFKVVNSNSANYQNYVFSSAIVNSFDIDQQGFLTPKTTTVEIQWKPQEQQQNSAQISTIALTKPLSLNNFLVTSNVNTVFKDVEVSGDSLLTLLPSNLNVLNLKPQQLKSSQMIPQIVETLPDTSLILPLSQPIQVAPTETDYQSKIPVYKSIPVTAVNQNNYNFTLQPGYPVSTILPQPIQVVSTENDNQYKVVSIDNKWVLLTAVNQNNYNLKTQPVNALSTIPPLSPQQKLVVSSKNDFQYEEPVVLKSVPVTVNQNSDNFKTQPTDAVSSSNISMINLPKPAQMVAQLKETKQKNNPRYTKRKCHQFLNTILQISRKRPRHVKRNVRFLIQCLVYNNMEPKQFCDLLEIYIKVSSKSGIVEFLEKSLPLLRHSMQLKEIVIQGIRPPNPTDE